MADFAGDLIALGPGRISPEGESSDVTAVIAITAFSIGAGKLPLGGNQGTPQPALSISHSAKTGVIVDTFGGLLFERVLILPSLKALGFVLTATEFPVEVWNTFRDSDQTLETIAISGTGQTVLADPYGEPLVYAAQDSRIYQATVPSSGDPTIDQVILFTFLSGILGTSLEITGSRIALFSVAPDWNEGMAETIEYLTDVLKAYSDNEQRRALRQLPRRALRFRALALNAINSAGMESLVWGWQNRPFGLPWWPDASVMTSDTPAGSFVIPCNTVDRQFAAGGLCCIWKSEYVFEALSIVSLAPGAVTVSSPTQLNWTGSSATLVMPVLLARIPESVEVRRWSSAMDQIDLQFIGEAQQPAPAPAISPTQYKGIDVLEISPNWDAALNRVYKRSMVTIDPKVGPIAVVDKGGTAIVSQEFPWFLNGHPAVTAFRAFVLRRFGQLNSFWIPTWDQDLVLAFDVGASDTAIVIQSEFYSRFFFPNPARRFIAFIPMNGTANVYRKVTSSTDNGNGTESLVLDTPTGKAFPAAQTMVSFLTLARLGSDRTQIDWMNADLAQANLALEELPRELPA
jgi:hypothetical protein